MIKADWEYYRNEVLSKYGIQEGDIVVAFWHWNFGSTRAKRERSREDVLDCVDDKGIILGGKRITYKVLDAISTLSDAYEPDGFVWLRDGDGSFYSTIL